MSLSQENERLEDEIALLRAMYPDQVSFSSHNREVNFKESEASFTLRLPAEYLSTSLPTVLSATIAKQDTRQLLKSRVEELSPGEEILDSVIAVFQGLVADQELESASTPERSSSSESVTTTKEKKATVIVWLHHLLNTNKRKQALSPAASVSGITKPGYPGVLIYAGPHAAVHEHVNELKGLNWAAFQVRMESEDEWVYAHGKGVKEVEGLGDVVKEIGEARKGEFMEAMRMK